MAEKLERMELEFELKDKVCSANLYLFWLFFQWNLTYSLSTFEQQQSELQELYKSEQLLTAELNEKLEKTEVTQSCSKPLHFSCAILT